MAEPSIPDEEQERIRSAMRRALKALEQREGRASVDRIAALTGYRPETVRSWLNGRRRPKPEFVRALAERSGVPAVELFAALEWLPAKEAVPWDPLRIAEQVAIASTALEGIAPYVRRALATLDTTAPAPVVAAQAVLSDVVGAARFAVTLGKVVSAGRYAMATNAVAEFRLRPGATVLSHAEAEALAESAGVVWRPDRTLWARDPDYWNTSLELRARTYPALSEFDVGQYTWQGEPGTTTWADAASTYPTHLLVQDPLGSTGRPAGANPWAPRQADTLVFLGGRHSIGPAAAVIAEAIGWQFVPVRSDVEVTSDGYVFPVRRDRQTGRALAWSSVARHIERCYRGGDPWRAVVLVRPSAFLDRTDRVQETALAALRQTPARVVYARSPREYLLWWAQRQQGTMAKGEFGVEAWVRLREAVYASVERELAVRARPTDLCVSAPPPDAALNPRSAAVPGPLVDATARTAWTAIRWLDETSNAAGASLLDQLRPGTLARWLPELRASQEEVLSRLVW